jgi:hypothetical protein
VYASNDVPVVGVSNTTVVNTTGVIAAVAAATFTEAFSSPKLSYRTLSDEALVKEPGWLPVPLVQPADERKEEVYSPGSSRSNSADHVRSRRMLTIQRRT